MSSTTPLKITQDIEQARQRREFSQLLMKCLAMDFRRNPERKEEIRDFCRQAIHDAQYLVQGKVPNDIIKETKECL